MEMGEDGDMGDAKITRLDPNRTRLKRKRIKRREEYVRPDILNNIEKFCIQLDRQMGATKLSLMKKWKLTAHGLNKVLEEKLDVTQGMQAYLRKLAFDLMSTVAKINSSIDQPTIQAASLPQRMLSMGIGLDKALAVAKHLDGTKDPRAPVLNFADRESLEAAVKRRLQEIPVVEVIEPEQQVAEIEEVEEEQKEVQLSLFPGSPVDWSKVEERNERFYAKKVHRHEDIDGL